MNKDPNDAPKSNWMHYYKCDACEHLHVLLMSDDNEPIATTVMSREMLMNMLNVIDGEPTVCKH
jgi:hypothetical protein